MSIWSALVDAAVVGAGRAAAPEPARVLAPLTASAQDDSVRLLHSAAATSRARRAGYRPADASELAAPERAEQDDRPEVSAAAARRLGELLSGERTELVLEWISLLASTDRRPPDMLVPDLLAAGAEDADLRIALGAVLGPLAKWLAPANPQWSWSAGLAVSAQPDKTTWTTASHSDRRNLLASLRETDPAAGRELVLSTWREDSARERAAFVADLSAGLGPADEEFLETARTDRRSEVRIAAARLLARLPGSSFSQRARARAAAAVSTARTVTGRRLIASPPDELTADMVADCIDPNPPRGTGRRAWLLRQLVAAAPAGWWAEYTGLPPRELLSLAAKSEWASALVLGWTDSAVRDGEPSWIAALLDRPEGADREVFQALRPADRDRWLRERPGSALLGWLDLVPAPWSLQLSVVARSWVARLAVSDSPHAPDARRLMRLAAMRLDPPAAPELEQIQVHPRLHDSWAQMLGTLSIRAAMRRELAEEPTP